MRWPEVLLSVTLAAAGVLHLLPLAGVLSAARLEALYGLPVREPALELLLRHRALMFGLLGALMLAGALRREWQGPAILVALASMLGFLLLAGPLADLSAPLRRVALADLVATLALLVALALRALFRTPTGAPA